MKYTTNLNLKKPETTDYVHISDLNNNADILDEYVKKNIMTVDLNTSNYELSSKSGALNFNHVLSSTGDKLTNENGGIKIGAGVSKVKVSCNLWINAQGSNRAWVRLVHYSGGTQKIIGDVISIDASGFVTGSISPICCNVSAEDYFVVYYSNSISSMAFNDSSGNPLATNLTVEVIE